MIVDARVKALANAIRLVAPAVDIVESNDPQFKAVERIVARHGAAAAAIVVANALVSYRLRSTGEEYWVRYAEWWETRPTPRTGRELVENLKAFLVNERVAAIESKYRRVSRALTVIEFLLKEADTVKPRELVVLLQRSLRAKGDEKTIFFAAKMLYYVYKALNIRLPDSDLAGIGMPIDSRIALLTSASGIVDAEPSAIYTRLRPLAVEAWNRVSTASSLPSIRIDALIWLPARNIEVLLKKGLLASARDRVAHRLYVLARGTVSWSNAETFARELLYRNPYLPAKQ